MTRFILFWLKSLTVVAAVIGVVMLSMELRSPQPVEQHAKQTPALALEEFFEGETVAFGIFEDRFGDVKRQFRVHIIGEVEGNRLTLDESFLYDDGEQAKRVWTITNQGKNADGMVQYAGKAADIAGTAHGMIAGNALNWSYDIDLVTDDGAFRVHFDDWIYKQHDQVAINRAYISKFGVDVGSVTLVFLRGGAAQSVMPVDLDRW